MHITDSDIYNFKRYLEREEKSVATIGKYVRDISALRTYLSEVCVTKEAIVEYKNNLITQGYSSRSINSILSSVNSFLKFMNMEEYKIKSLRVQKSVFRSEDEELTKDEYYRLILTAERCGNERLCLLLQTICGTGIRVSELKYITVEAAVVGAATVTLKGKTRIVFIFNNLQKKLLSYAARQNIINGPIFVTKNGEQLNRTNIWKEMKKICEAAEVSPKKVYPHNLRHLFARTFYEVDKDIAKLADMLGHCNINTTRIYITTTGKEHRKCLEQMNLVI